MPLPELPYRVQPDFFKFPPDWVQREALGVAVNSQGHINLFQRAKPMLSEFEAGGKSLRSLGAGLFDHPHGLRIDADDILWTTDDKNHTVLKLSPAGKVLLVLGGRDDASLLRLQAERRRRLSLTGLSREVAPGAARGRAHRTAQVAATTRERCRISTCTRCE